MKSYSILIIVLLLFCTWVGCTVQENLNRMSDIECIVPIVFFVDLMDSTQGSDKADGTGMPSEACVDTPCELL